jgi:hypothetical protein
MQKYQSTDDTNLHSHSIENQISVAIIGYTQMNAPIIALYKIATRVSFSEVHWRFTHVPTLAKNHMYAIMKGVRKPFQT